MFAARGIGYSQDVDREVPGHADSGPAEEVRPADVPTGSGGPAADPSFRAAAEPAHPAGPAAPEHADPEHADPEHADPEHANPDYADPEGAGFADSGSWPYGQDEMDASSGEFTEDDADRPIRQADPSEQAVPLGRHPDLSGLRADIPWRHVSYPGDSADPSGPSADRAYSAADLADSAADHSSGTAAPAGRPRAWRAMVHRIPRPHVPRLRLSRPHLSRPQQAKPQHSGLEPAGREPAAPEPAGQQLARPLLASRELVSRPLISPRLAADPRLRIWAARTVIATALFLGFTLWLGWRIGLTIAAVFTAADILFRSKTTAIVPPAIRVSAAQGSTRRRLRVLQSAGYLALNARTIPGRKSGTRSIIDHIVVGPAGVFVLDSERWDRRLPVRTISGRLYHGPASQDDRLEHSRWEAHQTAKLLAAELGHPVKVRPAMIIYGPSLPWTVTRLQRVDVFDGGRVGTYFRRQSKATAGHHLNPRQIALVYAAADRALPSVQ